MNSRLLSTLGICKKAGRLAEGFDPVAELIKSGGAFLVLTAADLSPKSGKEVAYIAQKHGVERIGISATMDGIRAVLGRRTGILAVADRGLAETVRNTAIAEGMVASGPPDTAVKANQGGLVNI
jgi:ribosomal protein L7Ae-like RNA K-turn-binding protein